MYFLYKFKKQQTNKNNKIRFGRSLCREVWGVDFQSLLEITQVPIKAWTVTFLLVMFSSNCTGFPLLCLNTLLTHTIDPRGMGRVWKKDRPLHEIKCTLWHLTSRLELYLCLENRQIIFIKQNITCRGILISHNQLSIIQYRVY